MKTLHIVCLAAVIGLSSCVVGVDGEGFYSGRLDPQVADRVLDHVLRVEDTK